MTSRGSSKSATGGSLKARWPFSPIPRQHRSRGCSAQQRGVPGALVVRWGQSVEVVGGPGMGPGGDPLADPAAEAGRMVGPDPHVLVHVEHHDVGPGHGTVGAERRASTKASWELPVANMAWATPWSATALRAGSRLPCRPPPPPWPARYVGEVMGTVGDPGPADRRGSATVRGRPDGRPRGRRSVGGLSVIVRADGRAPRYGAHRAR